MSAEGWSQSGEPLSLDGEVGLGPQDLALANRLTKRLISLRPMRWRSLGGVAPKGSDVVDVERVVNVLWDRGWLAIRRRRDRRGELVPAELRLRDDAVELASDLIAVESPHTRLARVDAVLTALRKREPGAPPIPERVLVREIFGGTKDVRLRDYRSELEKALGAQLEDFVRFHVDSVLAAGPVRYRFASVDVDLRGSAPWMAVTEPVVAGLTDLQLDGVDEVVCIENQTVFESLLYEGLAESTVVVFTSGYLGSAQKAWLRHLVLAGARRLRHWGDLDPWGLDIYRNLEEFVGSIGGCEVRPWRMGPEPLSRPDAKKLTPADWMQLHRYLRRERVPLRDTAEAMKRIGRKLEQEALI